MRYTAGNDCDDCTPNKMKRYRAAQADTGSSSEATVATSDSSNATVTKTSAAQFNAGMSMNL
jgi:hypothetical protein